MIEQYRQAIAEHRQRVYTFAHYSLRAPDDAEDVTQEVFIKLWQHWHKIDHDRLRAWLMRVAHNAVIDHVRKARNSTDLVDSHIDVGELEGGADNIAREIDQEGFRHQLMAVIRALDDPFRSIIIMRDVQGMTYAEIRHSLDMSESQVKVYLHRGRRKLRANPRLRQLFEACTDSGAVVGTWV